MFVSWFVARNSKRDPRYFFPYPVTTPIPPSPPSVQHQETYHFNTNIVSTDALYCSCSFVEQISFFLCQILAKFLKRMRFK